MLTRLRASEDEKTPPTLKNTGKVKDISSRVNNIYIYATTVSTYLRQLQGLWNDPTITNLKARDLGTSLKSLRTLQDLKNKVDSGQVEVRPKADAETTGLGDDPAYFFLPGQRVEKERWDEPRPGGFPVNLQQFMRRIEDKKILVKESLKAFFQAIDELINPLAQTLLEFRTNKSISSENLRKFFLENYNTINKVPDELRKVLGSIDIVIRSLQQIKGATNLSDPSVSQEYDKFIQPLNMFKEKIILLGKGYIEQKSAITKYRDTLQRGEKGKFDTEVDTVKTKKRSLPSGDTATQRILDEYGANPMRDISRIQKKTQDSHTSTPKLPKKRSPKDL